MLASGGITPYIKEKNGTLTARLWSDELQNAIITIRDNMMLEHHAHDKWALNIDSVSWQGDKWQMVARGGFTARKTLFYMCAVNNISYVRHMDDDFGILPMPKLNADQMEYGTITNYYATRMFVINHSQSSINIKGEAISAYLEFLSELSYTTVRPVYFDNVITPERGWRSEDRAVKSKAIFDVIVSNINYDLAYIYSPQISDISWIWRDALRNEIDLVSYFNQNKGTYESALKDLDSWFKIVTN